MREFHPGRINLGKGLSVVFAGCLLVLAFPPGAQAQEIVVASTSLARAMAKAAGAQEVRVLTPPEVRHPPEYELKPSDLTKLEGASVVVYAGYERMVSKLLETSKNKDIVAIQVDTTTSPDNLITQVRKISEVLRTQRQEQAWEQSFSERLRVLQGGLSSFSGKRAVVHRMAQPFAQWAGLSVVQVINPGELSPKAIADAIDQKPESVVDIQHFPVAQVIAENAKCKYIQVINFPGVENTNSLEDLFGYNSKQLMNALR
jgi:zinc transport system substrate-binding protein